VLRLLQSRFSQARSGKRLLVVTPNPEIIIRAQKDKRLAKILNSADLALPDGIGLAQAANFLSLPAPKLKISRFFILLTQGALVGLATFFRRPWLYRFLTPIKGREMFLDLVRLANKKGWRVFLLGDEKGSAQEAARRLRLNYQKAELIAAKGPSLDLNGVPKGEEDKKTEKEVVLAVNRAAPHLLFVGFGAPKQEKWLARWLPKLDVGAAMVVGGAFDYLSGRASLPPKWLENFGFEWLWRLAKQPWRLKRILIAFPIFPLKVFWFKLNTP